MIMHFRTRPGYDIYHGKNIGQLVDEIIGETCEFITKIEIIIPTDKDREDVEFIVEGKYLETLDLTNMELI